MADYPEYVADPKFYSGITVSYGNLVTDGFIDWTSSEWAWNYYNEEQKERLQNEIAQRFWYRNISVVPPGHWRREFLRVLNEGMLKYRYLYKLLEDEQIDPLQQSGQYGKSRVINSDFPETMLGKNDDFASTGSDKQFENINRGGIVEEFNQFGRFWKHPDILILEDLEKCFSCLYTLNINGYF